LRVHVHPEVAGPQGTQREIRRADLERVALGQLAHPRDQAALCHVEVKRLVIDRCDVQQGQTIQVQHGRPGVDFGARIALRPQAVAGDQRPIEQRVGPLGVAGGYQYH